MTSKEALETVKDYLLPKLKEDNSELGSIIIVESVNVLEQLVERDTPKEVEMGTSKGFKFPICPNCKTELNEYYKDANKFCKECGQRIDWSE